jgi:hypothetical protein
VAAHWLGRPELESGDSALRSGAKYNLARTNEALGKLEEAAALLEDETSPQRLGNKLRARRLKGQADTPSE